MPEASVNGIKLNYAVTGTGDPVVFIHGLGSSLEDWAPQIEAFSADYTCIALDVRGHGHSAKPPGPYSVKQFAQDTAGLISHLGYTSAHIVGVSMGGIIAFQMAVDIPAMVRSMVIINSGPEVPTRTLQQKMQVWQRLILFRVFSMRKIGETIGGRLFPEPQQAELLAGFVEKWAQNHKPAYLAATRALAGWSVMDHIGSMQMPTLVLTADMDYTPVAMKEAYVKLMPNARMEVVENARHAMNFAQPDRVNPLIAQFLEEQS